MCSGRRGELRSPDEVAQWSLIIMQLRRALGSKNYTACVPTLCRYILDQPFIRPACSIGELVAEILLSVQVEHITIVIVDYCRGRHRSYAACANRSVVTRAANKYAWNWLIWLPVLSIMVRDPKLPVFLVPLVEDMNHVSPDHCRG